MQAIEVGQVWETRGGGKVAIKRINCRGPQPICGIITAADGRVLSCEYWHTNGRYFRDSNEGESFNDLVRLLTPAPVDLAEQTIDTFARLARNGGKVPDETQLEWSAIEWPEPKWRPVVDQHLGRFYNGNHYRLTPIAQPATAAAPRFSFTEQGIFDRDNPGKIIKAKRQSFTKSHCGFLNDGITKPDQYTWEQVDPRYSVMEMPSGVLDSLRPNLYSPCPGGITDAKVIADRLNSGWDFDHEYDWEPIAKQAAPKQESPPRFTVSISPIGVLDSRRSGMILRFSKLSLSENFAHCLNTGLAEPSLCKWTPVKPRFSMSPDRTAIFDSQNPGKQIDCRKAESLIESVVQCLNEGSNHPSDYTWVNTPEKTGPLTRKEIPPLSCVRPPNGTWAVVQTAGDRGIYLPFGLGTPQEVTYQQLHDNDWEILRPGQDWTYCKKPIHNPV